MAKTVSFEGKTLYSTQDANPRRKDSIGYKSHRILLRHPEGILYEDFIKKGGEPAALRWDFAHGYVTTTKPRVKNTTRATNENGAKKAQRGQAEKAA
jgi:hypothetical protein